MLIVSSTGDTMVKVKPIPRAEAREVTKNIANEWLTTAAMSNASIELLKTLELILGKQLEEEMPQHIVTAFATLTTAFTSQENIAWRNAFMFGLTQSTEERGKYQKIAYQRFLDESNPVMHHLSVDEKEEESSWSNKSRRTFRRLLRKAFSIKKPQPVQENANSFPV